MINWVSHTVDFLSSTGRFLTSEPIIYIVGVFLFIVVARLVNKVFYEW